uniref:NADH-ubiquinone oxidoreductase chain 2 n=1 Tax=Oplophorus spinosus TaxID=1129507 RepID=A0A8A2F404_9EUCA|nr:NADH dehydrogenase subunit 2 [Oplophorus spinosus]QSV10487.1 NADH dehydrogenase subunit 2 [Oplophorus spinosus]
MLFFHPSQILFLSSLLTGTLITFSASSWFTAWLGLELNLLSFIPLISSKYNQYSSESSLKYFLIQALGSSIILASAPCLLFFNWTPHTLICSALLLKMGAAPVHFWFPSVMEGINWYQCIILMTIQKIGPMLLLTYSLTQPTALILFVSSILCSLIGGVGGLNQTLLRKIMAYSSINHMAWMIAALLLNESLWMLYFLVYALVSSSVVLIMHSQQIFHFNNLSSYNFNSPTLKLTCFLSLLSMGGLPPLLGFLPKWLVIQELATSNFFLWLSFLLFSALITLFYYLRVALTSMTLSSPKLKSSLPMTSKTTLTAIMFLNLFPILTPLSLTSLF